MFNLKKSQVLAIVFFIILSVTLFAGVFLAQKRQDIRPKANASSVSLQLFPATEYFTVGGEKVFELKAVFTGGIATEKIDYLKTEITFSNQFLTVPAGKYVDTSMSGLTKIFRVDGPVAANEAGKIIIELGAKTPGSGPATDKPFTIAKIYFTGKANTTAVQNIVIGATQMVNNVAGEIPTTAIGTNYTVGQSNITITPAPPIVITGKANFLIVSDLVSSTVGQNIKTTVSLQITDANVKVSGVDFMLLYDKGKLDVGNIVPNVIAVDPKAPFTDAPIVTSGGSFDDTFNFVRVSLVARRPSAELVGGTIKLADVIFRGRGVGAATIKFPDDNKYLEVVGIGVVSSILGSPPIASIVPSSIILSSNATLSLIPVASAISVNGTKSYELQASFPNGSATQKLDYFRTEINFNNVYLQVPAGNYVDTAASGFDKILRVDGPSAANDAGKIIIELGAKTSGGGPATDKTITLVKFNLQGKSAISISQNLTVTNTQLVNNLSQPLTVTAQTASYTVGQ